MHHQQLLEFIPANRLKKVFDVFGHFYSVNLISGEIIDCRSVLEIVTKQEKPSDIDRLLEATPDAIFIMMNPGSSMPLVDVNNVISECLINQSCCVVSDQQNQTTTLVSSNAGHALLRLATCQDLEYFRYERPKKRELRWSL